MYEESEVLQDFFLVTSTAKDSLGHHFISGMEGRFPFIMGGFNGWGFLLNGGSFMRNRFVFGMERRFLLIGRFLFQRRLRAEKPFRSWR